MSGHGVYDLGALELELRLADASFNLRLCSDIKFVTPEKDRDDRAALDHRLIQQLLDGNRARKPFVVKGHGYRLIVDLEIGPEIEAEDECFAQQVAEHLKQSKASSSTWSSLGLAVTSTAIHPRDNRFTSWVLSLEYNEHAHSSAKAPLHKLSLDVPYFDTKPPVRVPVVKVEAVHVKMLMTRVLEATARRRTSYDLTSQDMMNGEMLLCANDVLTERQSDLSDDPEDLDLVNPQCSSSAQQGSKAGTQKYDPHTSDMSSSAESCFYLTPPSSQEIGKRSRCGMLPDHLPVPAQGISTEELVRVIETGWRFVISSPPTRKSKTATVISNEDFKYLADIAPALWVFDFHRSVSDRAVLLPTISHAIANVSSRSSTNTGLDERVRQLTRQYSHDMSRRPWDNATAKRKRSQKVLAVELWQSMASALNTIGTTKRLQPFSDSMKSVDPVDVQGELEDMLDDAASDSESCQSCSESDFEDLLDTPSEVGSEDAADMDDFIVLGSELGSVHESWTEELEDRLHDGWDVEQPCVRDPDSAVVENGCYRRDDPCWDDSAPSHDSTMASAFCEFGSRACEAEDLRPMLPSPAVRVGARSPTDQVDLLLVNAGGEEDCVQRVVHHAQSAHHDDIEDPTWYEEELVDIA